MKKNKKKSKDVSVDENEKPVESVEHTPSLVLEPSQETKNLIRKAKAQYKLWKETKDPEYGIAAATTLQQYADSLEQETNVVVAGKELWKLVSPAYD